jgi:HSP20 family protein
MKTFSIYRPFDVENPFGGMDNVSRFMEDIFSNAFGSLGAERPHISHRTPCVDVEETDKSYIIEAELPGYDQEDVKVSMDGGTLTIESVRDEKAEKGDGKNYVMRERQHYSFNRSFRLPDNADPEAVSAAFKNGLLKLDIGKRTEAQKKQIAIT